MGKEFINVTCLLQTGEVTNIITYFFQSESVVLRNRHFEFGVGLMESITRFEQTEHFTFDKREISIHCVSFVLIELDRSSSSQDTNIDETSFWIDCCLTQCIHVQAKTIDRNHWTK